MNNFPIDYSRVIETFDYLPDWDSRYHFITELGDKLPAYCDKNRSEEYLVPECMSTVYIRANRHNDGAYSFTGDCDTPTIKGVVAILLAIFNGKIASDIINYDIDKEFAKLNLFEHLSPSRHVGVYAMVERVKKQVSEIESSYTHL